MRKIAPVILFASLFAVSQLVAARGGGASSGGSGAPQFRGPTFNSRAAGNSNGRFASDRGTGLARAQDRMSAQAKAHEKATDAVKKRPSNTRDSGDAK